MDHTRNVESQADLRCQRLIGCCTCARGSAFWGYLFARDERTLHPQASATDALEAAFPPSVPATATFSGVFPVPTNHLRARLVLITAILSIASLGGATVTSAAHTLVDPTTLTPPLKPFRVCYEDGPWVKCDTSGPTETYANQENTEGPTFGLPCGTIYESATITSHATRWYVNLLLVMRDAQEHIVGTWSLSPTGSGPTVAFAGDDSHREVFLVPGDLSSDVEVAHGGFLRVPALGAGFHDSGIYLPDGTQHGHTSFTDEAKARLCELLTP
jgi:hypothetical protein